MRLTRLFRKAGLRNAIDAVARAKMRDRMASDGRGDLGPWSRDNGSGAATAWPVIHTEVAEDLAAFYQSERTENEE